MAAGVTNRLWSVGELIEAAESEEGIAARRQEVRCGGVQGTRQQRLGRARVVRHDLGLYRRFRHIGRNSCLGSVPAMGLASRSERRRMAVLFAVVHKEILWQTGGTALHVFLRVRRAGLGRLEYLEHPRERLPVKLGHYPRVLLA